jgi:hypothetical protein
MVCVPVNTGLVKHSSERSIVSLVTLALFLTNDVGVVLSCYVSGVSFVVVTNYVSGVCS